MFSLLGAVLAFVFAAAKFLFSGKIAVGVVIGYLFPGDVKRGWAWIVAFVKARFAKKA